MQVFYERPTLSETQASCGNSSGINLLPRSPRHDDWSRVSAANSATTCSYGIRPAIQMQVAFNSSKLNTAANISSTLKKFTEPAEFQKCWESICYSRSLWACNTRREQGNKALCTPCRPMMREKLLCKALWHRVFVGWFIKSFYSRFPGYQGDFRPLWWGRKFSIT